jgi:uncharacterized short protein YbdD (DUF466 family)
MNRPLPTSSADPPVARGEVDVRELEKLFGASAQGVAAGLFSDATADYDGMRCMIPGCPEPHPWPRGVAPGGATPGDTVPGRAAVAAAFRNELGGRGLPRAALNAAARLAGIAWRFLREVSGDDAFERYMDHMQRAHPSLPAMTRGQYYRFRTEQKWNRTTRCC